VVQPSESNDVRQAIVNVVKTYSLDVRSSVLVSRSSVILAFTYCGVLGSSGNSKESENP
jgi:hypothetical protein